MLSAACGGRHHRLRGAKRFIDSSAASRHRRPIGATSECAMDVAIVALLVTQRDMGRAMIGVGW
jgi:hypothetical protein